MPSSAGFFTLSLHDALPISAFSIALTRISIGFFLVLIAMMSMAFLTMLVALALAPPATPGLIMSSIRRSTMLMVDLRNRPCSDRKSTRLNSSHLGISYAVFCRVLHAFPTRRSSDLGVLDCSNENLDRVLLGPDSNDVHGVLDNVGRSGFGPACNARPHHVID